jgi:hypothetical protein
MSQGITKAQVSSPASSATVAGSLSGTSIPAPSATINLSTVPGIIDWFVYTFLTVNAPSALGDLTGSFHWRTLGGLKILQTFRSTWGTAWFGLVDTPNVPPTAFSANASDDSSIDSWDGGTGPVHPLTAVAKCLALRATNAINFPDGWGYSLRIPAGQKPTTIELYLGVMNLNLDVTAHLTDGSAADVVVTISDSSGAGGALSFQKVSFTFNAGQTGNELIITTAARNTPSPAVEACRQSLQAVVLHF